MKKFIIGTLLVIGFTFVSGGMIYSQDMPGGPSSGPVVPLDEVLGIEICVVDNFGIQYFLNLNNGVITGTAQHPSCGFYSDVTGTYTGLSFQFHAGNPSNTTCVGYTFTGVVDMNSKTASGTWVNDGNLGSGTFTMGLCF